VKQAELVSLLELLPFFHRNCGRLTPPQDHRNDSHESDLGTLPALQVNSVAYLHHADISPRATPARSGVTDVMTKTLMARKVYFQATEWRLKTGTAKDQYVDPAPPCPKMNSNTLTAAMEIVQNKGHHLQVSSFGLSCTTIDVANAANQWGLPSW
jgi:hypothetical protein